MSTANPFYPEDTGYVLPASSKDLESLKASLVEHIARVTIEHDGLPQILQMLRCVEDHLEENRKKAVA